jgi:hypothetical protein
VARFSKGFIYYYVFTKASENWGKYHPRNEISWEDLGFPLSFKDIFVMICLWMDENVPTPTHECTMKDEW